MFMSNSYSVDLSTELRQLIRQLYGNDRIDVKTIDALIRSLGDSLGVEVPDTTPTIARLSDEKLKRTLWWHSGYQRALIDMSTNHKEISHEEI